MIQFFKKRLKSLGVLSLLFWGILPSQAYDFVVKGIYYNILSEQDKIVEVTHGSRYGMYTQSSINIPSTVEYTNKTYTVTSIGRTAFCACIEISKIELPNTIISIGEQAFYNCSNLKEIILSSSLINIDDEAFAGCINLMNIKFSPSLLKIGRKAFAGCSSLSEIDFSDLITEIKEETFYECTGLRNLKLGSSISRIEIGAFEGCSNLLNIEIPPSLEYIASNAFYRCNNLIKVNISDLGAWCNILFDYGSSSNPLYYSQHLYLNGEEIIDLIIPENITKIKRSSFINCIGIKNVIVSNSVESIDEYAFYNSSGIEEITLSSSLSTIGNEVFKGCTNLKNIICKAQNPPYFYPDSFGDLSLNNINLYVPQDRMIFYKFDERWHKFNIYAINIPNGFLNSYNVDVFKGNIIYFPINIDTQLSNISYSGFQFDVEMPEGLTITDVKLGDELIAAGFEATNSSVEGNPVRVISYKTNGNGVTTTDGFVTLTIKADANATEGKKTIKFTNARLSSAGGTSISLDDSSVTVTVKGTPVSAINVAWENGKQGDLYVDDTAVYIATVTPDDASDKTVVWSVEDPSVIQLTTGDDNSKVTVKALKIGETTLKATAQDGSEIVGTATIKVVATPITSVTISSQDSKTSIYPDETLTLTATVNPEKATTPITYKWTSSDSDVATITDNSASVTLTAIKTGTTDITVTSTNAAGSETSEKFTVTVAPRPITSVNFDKKGPISLYVGGTETLTAIVNPSNATNPEITWSSSQPGIATVDNGKITAVSLGSTNITVKATNAAGSQSTSITVNVIATPAEEIVITGDKYNLKVTEKLQLKATVTPAETTYPEVEWSTSDETKASVDASSGLVTAKAAGQVTITAKVKATPEVKNTYKITITDLLMGDANDDGEVDVADVITIVNEYLELPNDNEAVLLAYDFNNNGEADENDWKQTVDIILGQVGTKTRVYSVGANTELISSDNVIVKETNGFNPFSKNIEMELAHSHDYVAMSIEVLIPEGTTVKTVSKGNKLNNHSIAYNVVDDNRLKIAVYSMRNETFDNNNSLLIIELSNIGETEHVELTNIYATDSSSQRYSLGYDTEYAGINGVNADSEGVYHVFTIQGINVMNTEKAEDLNKLEKGIYIINGKKVMFGK